MPRTPKEVFPMDNGSKCSRQWTVSCNWKNMFRYDDIYNQYVLVLMQSSKRECSTCSVI